MTTSSLFPLTAHSRSVAWTKSGAARGALISAGRTRRAVRGVPSWGVGQSPGSPGAGTRAGAATGVCVRAGVCRDESGQVVWTAAACRDRRPPKAAGAATSSAWSTVIVKPQRRADGAPAMVRYLAPQVVQMQDRLHERMQERMHVHLVPLC